MTDPKPYVDKATGTTISVTTDESGIITFKVETKDHAKDMVMFYPNLPSMPVGVWHVNSDGTGVGDGFPKNNWQTTEGTAKNHAIDDLAKKIQDANAGFKNHKSLKTGDADVVNTIVASAEKTFLNR